MRRRQRLHSALCLLLLSWVCAASPAEASKCNAVKLLATGKRTATDLACHAKAVARGKPLTADCVAAAVAKLPAAFAKAETAGDCTSTGDVETFAASVAGLVTDVTTRLGGPGPSACTALKLKAAGKRAATRLGCQAAAVKKGRGAAVDPKCSTKVEHSFLAAFAKAERKGDCLAGTGDAPAVATLLDAFAHGRRAIVAPPVTTCSPLAATTLHGDGILPGNRFARIEKGKVPCLHAETAKPASCGFSTAPGAESGAWITTPQGDFAKVGQSIGKDGAPNGEWVVAADVRNGPAPCLEASGMDTAGRVAEGTELANICLIEDLLTRYNASSAEGGWTPMLNWTDGIVCSADAIHPDGAADYVGDGGHGPGVSCWTGFGAALNDPNGAERNWLGEYYVGDGYCHYFVSAGYEAPAAKRPAVRTLPAPGSVNVKSFILWRPYTQVNIANFRTPLPPGTTPTAPPGGTATPTAEETATPIEPASTDTATLLATPSPTPTAIPTSTSTPTRTRTPTPTPTPAPDLAVDTTADDALLADCDPVTPADCSLRGALAKTAGTLTPVRIGVPAGTYVLNGGATCQHVTNQFGTHTLAGTSSLCVRGNVTLAGAGADTTIIDGNATGRVLLVGNAGPVRVEGLTLRGGIQDGSSLFGGGGAVNNGGDLTLADSVVRDSSSTAGGGGIYSSGPLRIERCTITGNTARVGGGVYTDSAFVPVDATILDSTLADNHAAIEHGGGVFVYGSNAGGTTAIRGTTISANDAGTSGGGVALAGLDGTLVLTNSTISGNRCFWYYGGGLADLGRSTIQLRNVTVTGNRSEDAGGTNGAGGGIALDATTTATLANTVIAGNSAAAFAPDCYDATAIIGSDGYNLIGDAGDDGNGGTYCNLGDANGDRRGVDPLLGPLADNGGPTATHAPLAGSPAIDGGNPVGCTDENDTPLATDQRGAPRPVDGDGGDDPRCDAGAVEAQ